MRPESRTWFDSAYQNTRGRLHFGLATGEVYDADLRRIAGCRVTEEELCRLKGIFRQLYERPPPEEDFLEERQAVLAGLVPKLRRRLPSAEAAVQFGRVTGDIDIGLISPCVISDGELYAAIPPGSDMVLAYPMVDWDALYWFRAGSGRELAEKIAASRLLSRGCETLDPWEQAYVIATLDTAKLLWGNPEELSAMKAHKEDLPGFPHPAAAQL